MVPKVIEKSVAVQLSAYISTHRLDEWFQSTYKLHHSTETALVRVQNDILCAIDSNHWVILLLLDNVRGAGTRDEPLRTSAWEARVSCQVHSNEPHATDDAGGLDNTIPNLSFFMSKQCVLIRLHLFKRLGG